MSPCDRLMQLRLCPGQSASRDSADLRVDLESVYGALIIRSGTLPRAMLLVDGEDRWRKQKRSAKRGLY